MKSKLHKICEQSSKLQSIFNKVHGKNIFLPMNNLTIEIKSYWLSKLDNKFKIEYKFIELADDFRNLEEDLFMIDFIYDYFKGKF